MGIGKEIGKELAKGALGELGGQIMGSVLALAGLSEEDHTEEELQEISAKLDVIAQKLDVVIGLLRGLTDQLAAIRAQLQEIKFDVEWIDTDDAIATRAAHISTLYDALRSYAADPEGYDQDELSGLLDEWNAAVLDQHGSGVAEALTFMHGRLMGTAGAVRGGMISRLGGYYLDHTSNLIQARERFEAFGVYYNTMVTTQLQGLQCLLAAYGPRSVRDGEPNQSMRDALATYLANVEAQGQLYLDVAQKFAQWDFANEYFGGIDRMLYQSGAQPGAFQAPVILDPDLTWQESDQSMLARADRDVLEAIGDPDGVVVRWFAYLPEAPIVAERAPHGGLQMYVKGADLSGADDWYIGLAEDRDGSAYPVLELVTPSGDVTAGKARPDGIARPEWIHDFAPNIIGLLFSRYTFSFDADTADSYTIRLAAPRATPRDLYEVTSSTELVLPLPMFRRDRELTCGASGPRSHVVWPYMMGHIKQPDE